MSLMADFKTFALKGNVLDLAVGVVMGAAFSKIITALVEHILMPLLHAIMPAGQEWRTLELTPMHLKVGLFLGAVIDFTIVSATLFFFVVKPLAALNIKQPDVLPQNKQCPDCHEMIPRAAKKCRACGSLQPELPA